MGRRRRRRAMDSDTGRRRRVMDSDTNTVLELRMKKACFFKNVWEVLSELFTTADFKFFSTGLQLRATDTSGFPLVLLQLRSNICDDECPSSDGGAADPSDRLNLVDLDDFSVRLNLADMDGLSVRLNLADMTKAFSFGNNDAIFTIKYEKGSKIITISLDSSEGAVISDLDFATSSAAYGTLGTGNPECLYDAIVRMPRAKFMNFCNKLCSFWDTGDGKTAAVCISVDQDRVSFSTVSFSSDGKSSTIVCLQTQNDDKPNEATCIQMEKKISLTFDLRYLKNFSMVSTLSNQVTIKLSSDLTAVFEHKIPKMGYIRYHMMSDSSDPPAPPLYSAPVLELWMEEATFLKNLLEVLSLSGLFTEANFEFSSTGLELQATDTCCYALVVLQLHSKAFKPYICNNGGLSMGLILADLAKASSFANNDDIITIEAQDGAKAVVIKFKSPDGSVIQKFKLNFVSVNDVPVPIPEYQEFQYEAIIRMPSDKFMHICNRLSSLTDMETAFVCISVDEHRVQFFTDGIHGCLNIECQLIQNVDKSKEAATYNMEVKIKENVSRTFGLRYMSSLCMAYTLSQQVTIKLSSKLPAAFEYDIAGKGHIRYHVMPTEITEEDKDAELMTSGDKHDPFAYFAAIA